MIYVKVVIWLELTLRQSGVVRLFGQLGALPVPKAVVSDELSEQFLYQRFYNKDQISEIKQMGVGDFPQIQLKRKRRKFRIGKSCRTNTYTYQQTADVSLLNNRVIIFNMTNLNWCGAKAIKDMMDSFKPINK